jgi:hypothetical protein
MDPRGQASDRVVRLTERRRVEPRLRVLLAGKLAYPDSAFTADCSIRNLSETGALIITSDLALPPDPFLIVVRHAFLHRAQTAWRRGSKCGLRFVSSWRMTDSDEGVVPLRSLWLDLLPR